MSRPVFEWAESPGASLTFEPLVEVTKFLEGYEARSPTGLQDVKEVHELPFNNVAASIADDIEAFIRPGMGFLTFQWTPLRRDDPLVVKCTSFTRTLGEAVNTSNLRLRFEQVFEPL